MATSPFSKILASNITPTPAATAKVAAAAPAVGASPAALTKVAAAAPAVLGQPAPPPAPAANPAAPPATGVAGAAPTTVFVNNSQEYGSYQQMGPPGSTLLFQPNDPGFPAVMAAAQQAGYHVGIWIPQGQGPTDATQYGQYMAQLSSTYHPAIIVSNAETLSKNSAWDDTVMGTFNQLAAGQKVGLAVEPNQTINYKPWTQNGGQIFVETFTGNSAAPLTAQQAQQAQQNVTAQGVPPGQLSMMSYRSGTTGAQFGPSPNWWQNTTPAGTTTGGTGFLPAGSIPPEHGSPVTGVSGPAGPLAPGSIPPEHGNPVTGGPTGPTPPSTGTGAAGTTVQGAASAQNWASYYFGAWGLDTATMNSLVDIMSKYSDANDATMAALAYIRGTPWYAQHFPGIAYGIQKGLYSDESGYRDYVNRVNNYSEQFFGHAVAADSIVSYLQNGLDPATVGKHYEGQAYIQANQGDINYELGAFSPQGGRLSNEEQDALGNQQAGLPSMLGEQIQLRVAKAVQQMQTMFGGQSATPTLSVGSKGLTAPSLQGQKTTPDVAA